MVNTGGITDAVPPDQSVDLISFFQQKLCQIGAVLSCYSCDQCYFLHKIFLPFSALPLIGLNQMIRGSILTLNTYFPQTMQ